MKSIARQVLCAISARYKRTVQLLRTISDLARDMKWFPNIAGLLYCSGPIGSCHFLWKSYTSIWYFEYRCSKGFPSTIIFTFASSKRLLLYTELSLSDVLWDNNIYQKNKQKSLIELDEWRSRDVSSVHIWDIEERPHFLGDLSFSLEQVWWKRLVQHPSLL